MTKDRHFFIKLPAFEYTVRVEFTRNLKQALLRHDETENINLNDDPDDARTDALSVHISGDSVSWIFLHPKARAGTVAHECWHVIRRILEYAGAALENEVVAYHLGYLVDEVLRHQ